MKAKRDQESQGTPQGAPEETPLPFTGEGGEGAEEHCVQGAPLDEAPRVAGSVKCPQETSQASPVSPDAESEKHCARRLAGILGRFQQQHQETIDRRDGPLRKQVREKIKQLRKARAQMAQGEAQGTFDDPASGGSDGGPAEQEGSGEQTTPCAPV